MVQFIKQIGWVVFSPNMCFFQVFFFKCIFASSYSFTVYCGTLNIFWFWIAKMQVNLKFYSPCDKFKSMRRCQKCSVVWPDWCEDIVPWDRFGGEPWYKCSQRWASSWRALPLQQGIGCAKTSPAPSKLALQRPSLTHWQSSPTRRAPFWMMICRASMPRRGF